MSETALFFELACQKLASRCRTGGPVLALALLIPYEVVDNRPQFLWQLLGELGPAGLLAAIAPPLAGLAIFAASYLIRDPASLAIAVLGSLSSAALLIRMGADAAAWDVLPLPESLSDRPAPVLVSLALTAAGASLMAKPHARRVARYILYSSLALAVLYYARPVRGEAPAMAVWAMLRWLVSFPYWRMALGLLILLAIALAPAAISIAGVVRARRPPQMPHQRSALAALALYGPPAMMLMLVYRSFFSAAVGAHILGTIGTTFVIAALLGLIASAVEVLGEALALPKGEVEPPPARNLKRAGRAALAIAAPILLLQVVLSRPPAKGVDWTLRPPSEAADQLFGALIPAWDEARILRDRASNEAEAHAQARVDEAARAMIDAAKPLDSGLASAIEDLARGSADLHVAGRRFYRLVADVNEASRVASLPYYLDAIVAYGPTGDGLTRHLSLHAYTVERVQGFRSVSGSKRFATLHVRQLGRRRMGHRLLGLSRDVQPFALVVLDEVEPFGRELADLAAASPPACGASASEAAREGLERCGAVLAGAFGQAPEKLAAAVLAVTERHELQHQVDGPHLPTARAVSRKLAGLSDEEIDRVNRELSAYLSELTMEGAPASLGLMHLLRFALLGRGVEHLVAIIAFEALAKRPMGRGSIAAIELSKAFEELSSLPDEALRARAAEAWAELFGGTLPDLERGPG
ncbi:MAG TPA: hypothetical protein VE093_13795 [Polyangiaceae bacterium]|nr:hypothetical protein [Polyangiaceae bacterium]